jgi:hypothetical protein
VLLDANLPEIDPADIGFIPTKVTQYAQVVSVDTSSSKSWFRGCDQSVEQAVAAAIAATLPQGHGKRNRALWNFARTLKGIDGLRDARAKDLRPIVKRWHEQALPNIRTKAFSESWTDFVSSWNTARWALGENIVNGCFQTAVDEPLPKCAAELYDLREVQLLVGLCAAMQDRVGDEPFFLATRSAAELLGVAPKSVARWFHALEADEILVCVERGTASGRKASQFRFIGER